MIIKCTDEQVKQMAILAIKASHPMGLGFLHYKNNVKLDPEDLNTTFGSLHIDYYEGRMVKFHARKSEDGWQFADDISFDYQSWKDTYASYQDLFDAVNIEDLKC